MRNPAAMLVVTVAVSTLVFCNTEPQPQKQSPSALPAPAVSEIPIEVVEVPPPEKPKPSRLFSFTTWFKAGPKYEGRVTNITKLARMLDNIHIHPGEEFRFNKVVGPRTLNKGFKPAPTYFLGEIIPGVGGGSCQISSTMYAAALHVNVEVTDRRPHSRASSYIEPGLDATVSYPPECWEAKKPDKRICYDLKFKNPYDFDLIFNFEIGDKLNEEGKRSLTVHVLGTGQVPKVETKWAAYGAPAFGTRYRRVSYWHNDRKKLKQSGKPGLRGARLLTITHLDGKVEKKSVYSKYQPVPQVYQVGMEFEKPEEPADE
ncbi:MAG: VanW family protein [Planctomycetota bacterium]|jgi:hypothetical protein